MRTCYERAARVFSVGGVVKVSCCGAASRLASTSLSTLALRRCTFRTSERVQLSTGVLYFHVGFVFRLSRSTAQSRFFMRVNHHTVARFTPSSPCQLNTRSPEPRTFLFLGQTAASTFFYRAARRSWRGRKNTEPHS